MKGKTLFSHFLFIHSLFYWNCVITNALETFFFSAKICLQIYHQCVMNNVQYIFLCFKNGPETCNTVTDWAEDLLHTIIPSHCVNKSINNFWGSCLKVLIFCVTLLHIKCTVFNLCISPLFSCQEKLWTKFTKFFFPATNIWLKLYRESLFIQFSQKMIKWTENILKI